MATTGGPNIVRDGLVFGYDTGHGVADNNTPTRFYPGENTANLFPSPNFTNHADVIVGTTSVIKQDFGDGRIGIQMIQAGTSDIAGFSMGSYSAPVSAGTYTWSSFIHSTSTGGKVKAQVTVYVNGVRHWLTSSNTWSTSVVECNHLFIATVANQWHRIENQFTLPTGTLTNLQLGSFYRNTSNFTIKIANAQLESKSHTTPYVLGTRSSTASLIDLKKTTDIDVSNVSFDSTGQPTFDGSDDYISIDVDSWIRSVNSVTIEGVVIIPSGASLSGSPWTILTDHSTNSEKDGFWWHMSLGGGYTYFRVEDAVSGEQGITFSGATPFASGNTYHIVTIVGLNSVKIYVNGVLSKSYTPTFNWANVSASHTASLFIGRTFPGYWLNSTNPVVKVYDVALTEAEIKQNYNAYKNRFNI